MIIPNIWENKKCSKPPTSNGPMMRYNLETLDQFNSGFPPPQAAAAAAYTDPIAAAEGYGGA